MAEEVKITFETIYEILREEKKKEELVKLEDTFLTDIADYIKEKQSSTLLEDEKSLKQISNIRRMVTDIFDRREKKIIKLAMHSARLNSNFVDKSKLLDHELDTFSQINSILRSKRTDILADVIKLRKESLKSLEKVKKPVIKPKEKELTEADAFDENSEEQSFMNEPISNEEQSKDLKTDDNSQLLSESDLKVVFTKDVSKFVGEDMNIFGPYKKDDTTLLPKKIAEILIKRDQAKPIAGELEAQ